MEVLAKIIKEVENLKKKMKYENVTNIELILSFVSDSMLRAVFMFPEVFYMEDTCSTNYQNESLFLMVVKDSNGQTHIGNISILPSEKLVFNKIIRVIFIS